jgi:phosphoenolpyruvate carboxykinase (ATP)
MDLSQYGINLPSEYIIRNPSVPAIYEFASHHESRQTIITDTGALVAYSGKYMGRTPTDKRVVEEESCKDDIWWGKVNIPITENVFAINKQRVIDYLNTREHLFVIDAFVGWDEKFRASVRIITTRAYHALFMTNMCIRPTKEQLVDFEPDWLVLNAGTFPANVHTEGMTGDASVDLNFATKELIILGTQYAGEMKKGLFTVMNYTMPKLGHLSMHSSCNIVNGNPCIFFGLSGTGKTTLSTDSRATLIGDDEHVWTDDGIFNIEGGCYAKAIGLDPKTEPEIYNAIKFGTCLENVEVDPESRVVDYSSSKHTINTRAAYPLHYIENVQIPSLTGHPKNIIFLTCDSYGVLPPVSKLTNEQAMYWFISGYTSKVAGTEVGVYEPGATFSPCFGAPFIAWNPLVYARILSEKIHQYKVPVWLVNTGWTAGPHGVGYRIKLCHSRAIVNAIHDGTLENVNYIQSPIFNLSVPQTCPDVPQEILMPEQAWSDKEAFNRTLRDLGEQFIKHFKQFEEQSPPEILKGGPTL